MRTFCFSLLPILLLLPFTSWGGQNIVKLRDGRQFLLETSDTKNDRAPRRTASKKDRSDYSDYSLGITAKPKSKSKQILKPNPKPMPTPNPNLMPKPKPKPMSSSTPMPKPKPKPKPSSATSPLFRSRSSWRLSSTSLSPCKGPHSHGAPCTTWVKAFKITGFKGDSDKTVFLCSSFYYVQGHAFHVCWKMLQRNV